MTRDFSAAMGIAAQLTRAGKLTEATRIIQGALLDRQRPRPQRACTENDTHSRDADNSPRIDLTAELLHRPHRRNAAPADSSMASARSHETRT